MGINNNGASNNASANTPYKEALVGLGERILMCRRRHRIDQTELAEACNRRKTTTLNQARISLIERGETEPTWLEMLAIAEEFGKDLNEFKV